MSERWPPMGGLFVIEPTPGHGWRQGARACDRISVQGVQQIVLDAVDLQQRQVLARVGSLAMVLFLVPDVFAECRVFRSAHCECSVPVLPLEVAPVREALVDPSRRAGLDAAHKI